MHYPFFPNWPEDRLRRLSSRRPFYGCALLLLLLLAACRGEPAGTSPPVIPSPVGVTETPRPAPTATQEPTETAAPTVTLAVPQATDSPAAQETCSYEYFFYPAPETCPTGWAVNSAAAEQPFEGGLMIWLEETDSIIVFYDDGLWRRFEDTWSEDQPESDPDIIPPPERFQPIRGFGKVWRDRPEVREALGWALGVELGFPSIFQEQAVAGGQPKLTYLRTYNGQVFGLIQRAPDEGDWVVAADNR
ncbi:MAG: hypothetical protein JSW55_06505 [Chloroflexota bacterium]|nr:MAG: hypothetical protein JSW55_06505 [Chloroflexota bacterium]